MNEQHRMQDEVTAVCNVGYCLQYYFVVALPPIVESPKVVLKN